MRIDQVALRCQFGCANKLAGSGGAPKWQGNTAPRFAVPRTTLMDVRKEKISLARHNAPLTTLRVACEPPSCRRRVRAPPAPLGRSASLHPRSATASAPASARAEHRRAARRPGPGVASARVVPPPPPHQCLSGSGLGVTRAAQQTTLPKPSTRFSALVISRARFCGEAVRRGSRPPRQGCVGWLVLQWLWV